MYFLNILNNHELYSSILINDDEKTKTLKKRLIT